MSILHKANRSLAKASLRTALRLRERAASFWGDTSGGAMIMGAIMFPVMVGAMGLGAEASYRYQQQRKIQNAADAAAHGAAVRKAFGDPSSVYSPIGERLARSASWDEPNGTYKLNEPPVNGIYAGETIGPSGGELVEVVLDETVPRLLSSIYSSDDIRISAYSVAEVLKLREACVLSLDTAAPRAMEFSGSSSLTLTGCDIASNSSAADSVYQGGSSRVAADCINATGQVDQSGGISLDDPECTVPRENQPLTADPYAKLDEPAIEGPCVNWNSLTSGSGGATVTANYLHSSGIPSMHFCNQPVSIKKEVTFAPGLYILDGVDMTVNANALVNGSEVIFYLVNGSELKINGSGQLNLAARTSDPWGAILFFSSRTNSVVAHQLNGNSASSFEGVMYFPNAALDYNGGAGIAGACTQVIARTITFTGNSDFRSDCTSYPFNEIVTSALVQIID